MPVDFNFVVGGEAGQGVQSVGFLLAKVFARGGYHIFADQDYESRIRGGHNFFRVRVRDSRVFTFSESVDMLVALNKESIYLHHKELADKGIVLYDGEKINDITENKSFSVPIARLAEEKVGDKLMTNTVALGAALGLVGYEIRMLDTVLQDHFGMGKTAENNIKAALAGYEYAHKEYKGEFSHQLKSIPKVNRMLLTGNEAIGLGAIASGCTFVAGYPMTPTTPIIEYLASKTKGFRLVVVQPEDEIAAINMAIGASYAGVRAMTATSGGGFCLMVEGLGLAGMTETPIVVVEGQRAGPAIGLPTRTEQGDLEFMIHAAHGEFPRAILAPATIEDCFWLTVKAFNLADKYQTPVIILTDHHLASSYATVDKFDLSKVTIDRGILYSKRDEEEYRRHKVTLSGISPRAFPGQEGTLVITDSDEHDETGHLIEDAPTRTQQVQKRMRKLFSLKSEIATPQLYGPKKAENTIIGWGSTYGAIREAVDILRKQMVSVNWLHLDEIWPFPSESVADALDKANNSYVIENNATGQLARIIRAQTGKKVTGSILKYDGRPFSSTHIVEMINAGRCDHGYTC